jgi:hypothetical protein
VGTDTSLADLVADWRDLPPSMEILEEFYRCIVKGKHVNVCSLEIQSISFLQLLRRQDG